MGDGTDGRGVSGVIIPSVMNFIVSALQVVHSVIIACIAMLRPRSTIRIAEHREADFQRQQAQENMPYLLEAEIARGLKSWRHKR